MKPNRDMLEQQLKGYREKLHGLHSYIKELNDMTAKHGTERKDFEGDLVEAENDVKYYEGEIARITQEIGKLPRVEPTPAGADTILPRTAKQGIGSLIFSSISFVAGLFLGSKLKSQRSGKGGAGEKREE